MGKPMQPITMSAVADSRDINITLNFRFTIGPGMHRSLSYEGLV